MAGKMKIALFFWGQGSGRQSLYGGALRRWAAGKKDVTVFSDDPDPVKSELHYLRFPSLHSEEPFNPILYDIDDTPEHAACFRYLAKWPGVIFLSDLSLANFARATSHSPFDGWGFRWILGTASHEQANELAKLSDSGFEPEQLPLQDPLSLALARRSAAVVVPDLHSASVLSSYADVPPVSVIVPPVELNAEKAWAGPSTKGRLSVYIFGNEARNWQRKLEGALTDVEGIEITASESITTDGKALAHSDMVVAADRAQRPAHYYEILNAMAYLKPVVYIRNRWTFDIPEAAAMGVKPGRDTGMEVAKTVKEFFERPDIAAGIAKTAKGWLKQSLSDKFNQQRIKAMMPRWRKWADLAAGYIEPLQHPYSDPLEVEKQRVLERFGHDKNQADLALERLREMFERTGLK